jgi:hypothetical protein
MSGFQIAQTAIGGLGAILGGVNGAIKGLSSETPVVDSLLSEGAGTPTGSLNTSISNNFMPNGFGSSSTGSPGNIMEQIMPTPTLGSLSHATGGYITGPGTPTSDSIPARLSNGEYVLKARAVHAIGKQTLDAWNNMSNSPMRFATGGMVNSLSGLSSIQPTQSQSSSSPAPVQNIRVVMVDDQRNVGNYLSSSEGEKVLVNFVRKNSTAIKQVLR